jgi:hypothetical protein
VSNVVDSDDGSIVEAVGSGHDVETSPTKIEEASDETST